MKRTNTKPQEESFDLGYVVWADANTMMGGSTHAAHHEPVPMVTSGLIVGDDPKGVSVVMDFASDGSMREVRFIPRDNILEVRRVKKNLVSRRQQYVVFPPVRKRRKG